MNDPTHHPIVKAVLDDPVVKAVLEDPSPKTQQAVIAASEPPPEAVHSLPATAAPDLHSGGRVKTTFTQSVDTPAESEQKALTTAGQRNVNLIWESTQRLIALSVTWVALGCAAGLALVGNNADVKVAACVFIYGVANLVIGFYFGRTNHQKIGGVDQGR